MCLVFVFFLSSAKVSIPYVTCVLGTEAVKPIIYFMIFEDFEARTLCTNCVCKCYMELLLNDFEYVYCNINDSFRISLIVLR